MYLWLYSPLLDLGPFSVPWCFTQLVGPLRRRSVRRKVSTCTHTHIEKTHVDIHTSAGVRIHDPSFRAREDSSCLRQRGHCERLSRLTTNANVSVYDVSSALISHKSVFRNVSKNWDRVGQLRTSSESALLYHRFVMQASLESTALWNLEKIYRISTKECQSFKCKYCEVAITQSSRNNHALKIKMFFCSF
jgi:hypothetical protein